VLKKIVFPALLASGIVFSSCSLLVAQLESKSLEIRLEEQEIFVNNLRTLFSFKTTALLSLGVGVTTAALMGWKDSLRKSSEVERQLSSLQKSISVTDSLIEEFQYSQLELVDSEKIIVPFLENELPVIQDKAVSVVKKTGTCNNSQPMVISTPSKIGEPWLVVDGVLAPETEILLQTRQKAISLFACTQSVLGLTQIGGSENIDQGSATTNLDESLSNKIPVQELQAQLQKISEQMKQLDTVVQSKTQQGSLKIPHSTEMVNYNHPKASLSMVWRRTLS
jgi:hypothetical protein